MNPELQSVLKKTVTFTFLGYLITKIIHYVLPATILKSYQYWSIEGLFFVFGSLSLLLLIILVFVMKKNFDQTGMVFLVLTSIQLIAAFFIGKSIIYATESRFEKINFYGIFAYFLVLETVLTINLLNKKQ